MSRLSSTNLIWAGSEVRSARQPNPAQPSGGRRPAGPLAPASFSEQFASGYNVVWVTLVFGKTLIDYCTMSIAQRRPQWIRSDAFPDKFGEAQPFLDRKLKDFSNIRITHGRYPTTILGPLD